jgi:hypothetical protein
MQEPPSAPSLLTFLAPSKHYQDSDRNVAQVFLEPCPICHTTECYQLCYDADTHMAKDFDRWNEHKKAIDANVAPED